MVHRRQEKFLEDWISEGTNYADCAHINFHSAYATFQLDPKQRMNWDSKFGSD
jgi:hypothetical protein